MSEEDQNEYLKRALIAEFDQFPEPLSGKAKEFIHNKKAMNNLIKACKRMAFSFINWDKIEEEYNNENFNCWTH